MNNHIFLNEFDNNLMLQKLLSDSAEFLQIVFAGNIISFGKLNDATQILITNSTNGSGLLLQPE